MVFDFLRKQFIDVIEWTDEPGVLAIKYPMADNEIQNGGQLTVREGQMAAFINEGQLADVFKPGTHTLTTQNMPILATLRGWKYGFNSPFKAEVYFVSTRKFTDLKWGTPGPATMRDKEFDMVRVTAFGIYAIRVKDPGTFIKDLVGTDNRFTTDEVQENLRGKIGLRIKEVLPEMGIPVLELEAQVSELGKRLRERLAPDFEGMGIELVEVQVQDIGLPEEVEKAIDKRGAIKAVGNLQAYTQYETASSIRDAANNPGGAAGVGVGLGAGMAMGAQMVNAMGGAMGATAGATPPPVPGALSFHIAVNGQQTGPFDAGALQQQVASGGLTRNSLVWRAGMAQWVKAGEVPELAALFAHSPPPVPPA